MNNQTTPAQDNINRYVFHLHDGCNLAPSLQAFTKEQREMTQGLLRHVSPNTIALTILPVTLARDSTLKDERYIQRIANLCGFGVKQRVPVQIGAHYGQAFRFDQSPEQYRHFVKVLSPKPPLIPPYIQEAPNTHVPAGVRTRIIQHIKQNIMTCERNARNTMYGVTPSIPNAPAQHRVWIEPLTP